MKDLKLVFGKEFSFFFEQILFVRHRKEDKIFCPYEIV